MNKLKQDLLRRAERLELWAVWDDPAASDGVGAALIIAAEDEHTAIVTAVRVANEDEAGTLYELVSPEMQRTPEHA